MGPRKGTKKVGVEKEKPAAAEKKKPAATRTEKPAKTKKRPRKVSKEQQSTVANPKADVAEAGSAISRCSTQLFMTEMNKVLPLITEAQRDAMMKTPFTQFLNCSLKYGSLAWMEAIVKCYDERKDGFVVGKGIVLKFPSVELSCVLGLRNVGVYVHTNLEAKSETVNRFFDEKFSNVKRTKIIEVLQKVAGNEEWQPGKRDAQDFARIFILWVFNTILFPNAHMYVPPYLLHLVDNLETIHDYAWGKAVHQFLVRSLMKRADGRRYVDGCTFGLVVS